MNKDEVLFYIAVLGFSGTFLNWMWDVWYGITLAPIKNEISEVKKQQDDLEHRCDDLERQIIQISDSSKQAHKRIDELRRKEDLR